MKTLTLEQIIALEPCWLNNKEGATKLHEIGSRKEAWSALGILGLPSDEVSGEDKLWLVLREEFIDGVILHEFACQCAERALELIENPDPRSVAAIEAKRKWLRGEIDDSELSAADSAAWSAAQDSAGCSAARSTAWSAARPAARSAACSAAQSAACSAARSAEGDAQIQILIDLLKETQE